MKKIFKNKKSKIITAISITFVVLIVAGIFSYKAYGEYRGNKELYEDFEKQVSTYDKEFNNSEDRVQKFEAFKNLLSSFDDYNKSKVVKNGLTSTYKDKISEMRKYFTDEYNNIINENTLTELTDKEKISTAKSNLETVLNTIKNESEIVNSPVEDYENKINTLVASYDSAVASIEQKEAEEAVAKAEAKEE